MFIKIKSINKDINRSKNFYDYLLSELKIFEEDFAKYLNSLYSDKEKINKYDLYKQELFSKLLINDTRSIDTFNYTNPLSTYLFRNSNLTYWHINGSLEKDDEIIFGIDVDGIKPEDNEYIFTKTYRRLTRNINLPIIKDFNCNNVIIYGHSLNRQDYSYFFSLFDNLELSNHLKKSTIAFAYHVYNPEKRDDDYYAM